MRVAIAGIHHETNTFSPVPADLAAYERAGILCGGEIVEALSDSSSTVAGFIRCCEERGVEIVPILYANQTPCGATSAEAFAALAGGIIEGLRQEAGLDVVLLAQHGAAVGESHPDLDGELLVRVREAVGPDVVVGMALDLHANVSERMVAFADVVVGYRENPHRDADQRAFECAALAISAASEGKRPSQCLRRLPMVVPILGGWTGGGAMGELMDEAAAIALEEGLLTFTVFQGFGYADVAEMGSSVLAVAADSGTAERAARRLAEAMWRCREQLDPYAPGPAEAVAEAVRLAGAGGPVVLLDVGDNIGGGSPGDSTVLLDEATAAGASGVVCSVWDEEAAGIATIAGAGAEVDLSVGGRTAVSVGPVLRLRGRVARLSDGVFEDPGPTHAGVRRFDAGPTARVTLDGGNEVLITSRAMPSHSPEQLRDVGLEPERVAVIVAKGVVAPRAGYEPIAAGFVLADTPGITTADLSRLDYRNRPASVWPLDRDAAPAEGTPR